MNLKKLYYAAGAGLSVMAGSIPFIAQAQPGRNPFDPSGTAAQNVGKIGTQIGQTGDQSTRLPIIIGNIINVVLGFMGIVLLFYLLYGGFLWMTSGGDSKGVDAAKTMIRNAIIGLVIIVSSYAISSFVLAQLLIVTS
ncbi:hypothetical protein IPH19_03515 [Candidatus Uhrbacteria bacterium]|nr:MAG: hypothetical protein IPH19_03515 [Candidatus Uhrbacteria bacterium]